MSYAGPLRAAGRIRTCVDEFRKLAPRSSRPRQRNMVETKRIELLLPVCRTSVMPLDHVPNQTSSRGPESRTRTLLLPRQAAFQQALTPKLAVGAGFEPAHLLINNQAPYQLGHPTSISNVPPTDLHRSSQMARGGIEPPATDLWDRCSTV